MVSRRQKQIDNPKLRLVTGCALARGAELTCDFSSIPPYLNYI
jgi:hypothetical protein